MEAFSNRGSNNLSCMKQSFGEVFKKASKCLVQLKKAKLPSNDLVLLYTTYSYIRSIIFYVVLVFHYISALPKYLQKDR